ncbi:MAG: hypothetical protein ABIP75_02305 [Pyrinomonadaceae bacterium]
MGVGRVGGGIIAEWIQKKRDIRAMERRLGRKVSDEELTSISAWMEEPAVPRPPRLSHVKRNFAVLIGIVGVAAVCFAYFFHLGPFQPRQLAGSFPEQIANFKRNYEPKGFYAVPGDKYFSTTYTSPSGTIDYRVDTFPSVEAAKKSWTSGSRPASTNLVEMMTISPPSDGMLGRLNQRGLTWFTLLSGASVISINYVPVGNAKNDPAKRESNTNSVADFVNHLPYAVFGGDVPKSPVLFTVTPAVQVLALLDEFSRDKAAALKKYQGQYVFLTGVVAGKGTDTSGKPFLAFQKPGSAVGEANTVAASFVVEHKAALLSLQLGQEVILSGIVKPGPIGGVVIEGCELE